MFFRDPLEAIRFYETIVGEQGDAQELTNWPDPGQFNKGELNTKNRKRSRRSCRLKDFLDELKANGATKTAKAIQKKISSLTREERIAYRRDIEGIENEELPKPELSEGCYTRRIGHTSSNGDNGRAKTNLETPLNPWSAQSPDKIIMAKRDIAKDFRTFIDHHGAWAFEALYRYARNPRPYAKRNPTVEEKSEHKKAKEQFYNERNAIYGFIKSNIPERNPKKVLVDLLQDLGMLLFSSGYIRRIADVAYIGEELGDGELYEYGRDIYIEETKPQSRLEESPLERELAEFLQGCIDTQGGSPKNSHLVT